MFLRNVKIHRFAYVVNGQSELLVTTLGVTSFLSIFVFINMSDDSSIASILASCLTRGLQLDPLPVRLISNFEFFVPPAYFVTDHSKPIQSSTVLHSTLLFNIVNFLSIRSTMNRMLTRCHTHPSATQTFLPKNSRQVLLCILVDKFVLSNTLCIAPEFPGIRMVSSNHGLISLIFVVQLAVKNALRYFPAHLHPTLAPEFARELRDEGHIYMRRFRPREYAMKAYPIECYPGKCDQVTIVMRRKKNSQFHFIQRSPNAFVASC
jgi:hypothetical protein